MFLLNLNLIISIVCLMVIMLNRKYGTVTDPFETLNEMQKTIDEYRENGQDKIANFFENATNSIMVSSMNMKLLFIIMMSICPILNIALTISISKDLLNNRE